MRKVLALAAVLVLVGCEKKAEEAPMADSSAMMETTPMNNTPMMDTTMMDTTMAHDSGAMAPN